MEDSTKRKLVAGGKVAVGAAQVVSGCLTAVGKGIVGSYLRNHHMMRLSVQVAKQSIESGTKRFKEGMDELNR